MYIIIGTMKLSDFVFLFNNMFVVIYIISNAQYRFIYFVHDFYHHAANVNDFSCKLEKQSGIKYHE